MILVQQTAWHWMIAAYLFFGGLGGGVMALGALADLLLQKNDENADRRPALFAAILGVGALGIGSLILLFDLEQPFKSYLAVRNLRSWIAWGVIFISLYMVATPVYALPYLFGRKVALGWQKAVGTVAGALGILVAIYTGFLLASARGIPFWNPRILPAVFVISGISTGAASMMLYLIVASKTEFSVRLLHRLERWDVGLILFEIAALGLLFWLGYTGHEAAAESVRILTGSAAFLIGVPVFGLLLPLSLEWLGLRRHSVALSAAAGVLVITGGALLRFFVLQAGVWGFPVQ